MICASVFHVSDLYASNLHTSSESLTVSVSTVEELNSAIENLISDTTISIADGTYNLTKMLPIGNMAPAHNVVIRGQSGNRDSVRIFGEGMGFNTSGNVPHCFQLFDCRNLVLRDMTIGQVYWHPITIQGSRDNDNPSFINLHLLDAGEQFIKVNNNNGGPACDGGLVEDCLIEYSSYPLYWPDRDPNVWNGYYTKAFDLIGGGVGWIFRSNTVKNIRAEPGKEELNSCGPAVLAWCGPRNFLVEKNNFINCRIGVSIGIGEGQGVDGAIVRNNFFYNDPAEIDRGDVAITVRDSTNVKVFHNTAYLSDTYKPLGFPVVMDYIYDSTGLEVVNNLFDGGIHERTGGLNPLMAGNICDAQADWFADLTSCDLHLSENATAPIDSGAYNPYIFPDYDGENRPMGNGVDVGADEKSDTEVPVLYYSSVCFNESSANDGSISASIRINVQNERFSGSDGDDFIDLGKVSSNAATVAPGLIPRIERVSQEELIFTLQGRAIGHSDINDVSNLSVLFDGSALEGGDAQALVNGSRSDISLDFLNADGIKELVRYVNTSSASGGNGKSNAVSGCDRAYSSLAEWESSEQKNLVALKQRMIVICSGSLPDTSPCEIYGWTTNAESKIIVMTEIGMDHGRHSGKWNDSCYRIEVSSTSPTIHVKAQFITIDGLQISNSNSAGDCIRSSDHGPVSVKNCVVKDGNAGIILSGAFSGSQIVNNIVYGSRMTQYACAGVRIYGTDGLIANNTVSGTAFYSNWRGAIMADDPSTVLCNNISFNNSGYDYYCSGIQSYNISEDSTALGNGSIIGVLPASADQGVGNYIVFRSLASGSEDFHLLNIGAEKNVAIGAGTALDEKFANDIDGEFRPLSWDIGADQALPALHPPVLTPDNSDNNVDNVLLIAFDDDPAWRASVSSVLFGGADITPAASFSEGQMILDPSLDQDLQTPKEAELTIYADGYYPAKLRQGIHHGSANKLLIILQPGRPDANGALLEPQPSLRVGDKYGNTVWTSFAQILSEKNDPGNWSLGGTTTIASKYGIGNFTDLTASSPSAVNGAQIMFSSNSLISASSDPFDIPATVAYDFYVSASSGDDLNGDGSQSSPYASLRKAVNTASSGDSIFVFSGIYTEPDIVISKGLNIVGEGAKTTIVQAAESYDSASSRVFTVNSSENVSICGLTIRHGKLTGNGGGISIAPSIASSVAFTIDSCEIRGNISNAPSNYTSGGGGIHVAPVDSSLCNLAVSIMNSTLEGNSALSRGGGIFICRGGNNSAMTSVVRNCTISGNIAAGSDSQTGGGISIHNHSSVITNSTIVGNSSTNASGGGGGIGQRYGSLTLTSTIVAGNSSEGDDEDDFARNSVTLAENNNIIGVNESGSSDFSAGLPNPNSSYVGTASVPMDPFLNVLADNGGQCRTCSIKTGSPALDRGSNPATLEHDQRGEGFSRTISGTPDIGAFEKQEAIKNPPILLADESEANVDHDLEIAFCDNPEWRSAISVVRYGASVLVPSQYSIAAGLLTIKCGTVQKTGTETISVSASSYYDASVEQDIAHGAPVKLLIGTQPGSPLSNAGALSPQPIVRICDQYDNTATSSSAAVSVLKIDSRPWTLSGTTEISSSSGVASFSGLSAGSAVGMNGARLRFSSPSLGFQDSETFVIPSHEQNIGIAQLSDTYVSSVTAPAADNSAAGTLQLIGRNWDELPTSADTRAALFKFDLSGIPAGSKISDAKFRVYCTSESSNAGGTVTLRHLNESWNGSACYNTKDGSAQWKGLGTINQNGSMDPFGSAFYSVANYPSSHPGYRGAQDDWANKYIEFSINSTVASWVSGTKPNNGFIMCTTGYFTGNLYGWFQMNFNSAEAASNKPELSITYQPPVPITWIVSFQEGDSSGTLTGQTSQTVSDGEDCSAVTAVPNSGFRFVNWSGDYSGIQNPLTITNVTEDTSITANFARVSPQDFNGDSKSDVICESPLENGFIYFMNGVTPSAPASAYDKTDKNWTVAKFADFNGDGKCDMLWKHEVTGQTLIYIMNGSLVSYAKQLYGATRTWSIQAVADFNGDSKSDVLIRHTDGSCYIHIMNGVASSDQGNVFVKPPTKWTFKVASDFDGDGKCDMLWQNSLGEGWIAKMDGKSVVSETKAYQMSATSQWQAKLFGDFNGDSKTDMLWEHSDGSGYVYLMDGSAILSGGYIYYARNANWNIVSSGDFNGDGKADILWEDSIEGIGCIYLMNGAAISDYGNVYDLKDLNPSTKWSVVKALDFNGDGKSDLLWENAATKKTLVYLMDGLAISSSGTVYSNGTGWRTTP